MFRGWDPGLLGHGHFGHRQSLMGRPVADSLTLNLICIIENLSFNVNVSELTLSQGINEYY